MNYLEDGESCKQTKSQGQNTTGKTVRTVSTSGSSSSLQTGTGQGAVGDRGSRIGSSTISARQQLHGLILGNVTDPVVLRDREQFRMDSTDKVLKDGVVHGHGASEPVTAVVGVDQSVFSKDGLVLDELESGSGCGCGGELVVLQEGFVCRSTDGFVNQDINRLNRGRKSSRGREARRISAVKEGRTSISGEDTFVSSTREEPRCGVVVVRGRCVV